MKIIFLIYTNESTTVALKENIKDVCFVQINDDSRPSKVFLLNESKIYVENLDRYFDLPIKDSSLLTAVDNKNLFSMNKRGDLVIFRIFNNRVDIKESLVPGFKNNSYTETEYLILKNKSILLSHNGKAEIILQSLDSSQPADQAKKERQESIVVDTDKKMSLAGKDDEKATAIASLESVNQANMKQTKSGPVGVENKLDDILSQDKEKKNNTPKLNTTLTRDTIIVDVGENTVININLKGVFLSSKYALKIMEKNKKGCIVNNSSISAFANVGGNLSYAASKGGVMSLTRVLAIEYASKNIRVNAVGPGPIRTPMLEVPTDGHPEQFGGMVPMKRIGEPKEISDAVQWLLSTESSYVTGHTLMIDGGFCSQ